jgi:hypothetical protein
MTPGARNVHDDITVNLLAELRGQLRGGGCRPFTGDGAIETLPCQIRRPDPGVLYLGVLVTVVGLWIWLHSLCVLPVRIVAGTQYLQPLIGTCNHSSACRLPPPCSGSR